MGNLFVCIHVFNHPTMYVFCIKNVYCNKISDKDRFRIIVVVKSHLQEIDSSLEELDEKQFHTSVCENLRAMIDFQICV